MDITKNPFPVSDFSWHLSVIMVQLNNRDVIISDRIGWSSRTRIETGTRLSVHIKKRQVNHCEVQIKTAVNAKIHTKTNSLFIEFYGT